jgi:DUF4097 and DUF4098 domain-containing protein YvlB
MAKDIAGEIRLEAGPEGKGESDSEYFMVRTNRETLSSRNYMFNTDMEIFVPKNSQVQVRNTFGEVRAAEIDGKLDLGTTHRAIEVRDCTGQFRVSSRYGECRLTHLVGNLSFDGQSRLYIDTIKGDVTVTDEYSPMEIVNVDGKVSIAATEGVVRIEKVSKAVVIDAPGTQVSADNLQDSVKVTTSHRNVDISGVAGDVAIDSRYGTLALKNVRGNVDIGSNSDRINADDILGGLKLRAHGSGVRVNGIRGPLDIQTTLKDVIVNDFADACSVTNEYAAVSVSAQSLGKGDVNVKDRNGDVDLFLPEGASFAIDATARNGKVESDYKGLEPTRNSSGGVLKSKVKTGGPRITLETDYSNIHIYRTRPSEPGRFKSNEEARQDASGRTGLRSSSFWNANRSRDEKIYRDAVPSALVGRLLLRGPRARRYGFDQPDPPAGK